ncbi:glycosyltransferase family 2 protein [Gemmiger sp.]
MKPCEIAVIVPVYNAAAFLTACTDSIAAQKFDGFRCILVDDGSTDGSPALCDAIAAGDGRFLALHRLNRGVCAARTAGVQKARELGARWFAFCDADDLYHPELLDVLYTAALNSGLPLACCRYDTFTDAAPADGPAPENCKILRSPAHLDALLHDHAVDYGLWNKLYSADLLTDDMLDNGLAYNEDLLANWRAFSKADGCAFCDFAGYHYRQHAASASHRALPPQSIDDQRRAAAEIRATAPDAMRQSVNAFYYEKLVYLASMILRRANAGDYRVQLGELKIALTAGEKDPQLGRNPLLPKSIRLSAWLTLHAPRLWQWACRKFLKDRQ